MLSNSQKTFLRSLHDKSGRRESGCFLVEGEKNILEFLASSYVMREIIVTEEFAQKHATILYHKQVTIATQKEIEKISTLASNDIGVAVFEIPRSKEKKNLKGLTLILDGINDPGNLGTIIRTTDWYGITHIIASTDTVDAYNPKVVMATKGSLTKVYIEYLDLEEFLMSNTFPKYGAFLDGQDVHEVRPKKGECFFLIIGSESHGIRPQVAKYISHPITIPRRGQAESLNAAIATGIILDNFFR